MKQTKTPVYWSIRLPNRSYFLPSYTKFRRKDAIAEVTLCFGMKWPVLYRRGFRVEKVMIVVAAS